MFELFVEVLEGLGLVDSPTFSRRAAILDSLARVKMCIVMLDLDCAALVRRLYEVLFEAIQ